jgi:phosphatidylglycerol:prolipoprotein diacylglycerol transferase
VLADPTYLIRFWDGLSSFGGFIGAITGVFVFKWRKKERDVMPYMDTVCSAFPLAWVIGRAGCATVHDHPGRETSSWMGVQFPEFHTDVMIKSKEFGLLYDPTLTVGRFDLGLTEMVLAIPLAVAFMILWQIKPRNYGFWAGWQCIAYAPVRFVLDFLRVESAGTHEGDPRYLGLTPAQYACFGFIAIGIIVLKISKQYPAPRPGPSSAALIADQEDRAPRCRDGGRDEPPRKKSPSSPRRPSPRSSAVRSARSTRTPTAKSPREDRAQRQRRGTAERASEPPPVAETLRSGQKEKKKAPVEPPKEDEESPRPASLASGAASQRAGGSAKCVSPVSLSLYFLWSCP